MICKKCGAKIDDNAVVCEFCGEVYGEIEKTEEMEPISEAPVLNAEDEVQQTEEIAVPETWMGIMLVPKTVRIIIPQVTGECQDLSDGLGSKRSRRGTSGLYFILFV